MRPPPINRMLLCVSGSSAATETVAALQYLRAFGAQEVRCVATASALKFLGDAAPEAETSESNPTHPLHIDLALWADVVLVSPCSANTLAKLARGLADNLLTTTVLATPAPVYVLPSMNRLMWAKPVTQRNVQELQAAGLHVIPPLPGTSMATQRWGDAIGGDIQYAVNHIQFQQSR